MRISERPNSLSGGRKEEFEQGFSNHSNRGSFTKWTICGLPCWQTCNFGNIKFKTFNIYTSEGRILWGWRIHNSNSICCFEMCLFCFLFYWPLSCIWCYWPLPPSWSFPPLTSETDCFLCFISLRIPHFTSFHAFPLPLKYHCPLGSILTQLSLLLCPFSGTSMAEITVIVNSQMSFSSL